MKEKPILFSMLMVKAILAGKKTQTRRVVPEKIVDDYYDYDTWCDSVGLPSGVPVSRQYEKECFLEKCPHEISDILWVRETIQAWGYWVFFPDLETNKIRKSFIDETDEAHSYRYDGDFVTSPESNTMTGYWKRPGLYPSWYTQLSNFL